MRLQPFHGVAGQNKLDVDLTRKFNTLDWELLDPRRRYLKPLEAPRIGFLVYRTWYGPGSDAPFAELVSRLLASGREELINADRLDLADRWTITPVEDSAALDCAKTEVVRERFDQWCVERGWPRRVPRPGDPKYVYHDSDTEAMADKEVEWNDDSTTRATHCLFVDKRCIEYMEAYDGWSPRLPIVGVLSRHWLPMRYPLTRRHRVSEEAEEDGEDEQSYEDLVEELSCFPAVEGCTDMDLGWIYHWTSSMVQFYASVARYSGGMGWGNQHSIAPPRPPGEVCAMFGEEDYGFGPWRGDVEEGHFRGVADVA